MCIRDRCIGAGETHAGTHRLLAEATEHAAADLAEQAAEQLAPGLFEILRGQPDAESGEEILDMATIEFETLGLADPIDQLHLQWDDCHRRQRFG